MFLTSVLWCLLLQRCANALVYDFEQDLHGVPNDHSPQVLRHNRDQLSIALQKYSSGNKIVIPGNRTFFLMHGVFARDIHDVVIQIDGTLKFQRHTDETIRHPYNPLENRIPGQPSACIQIDDSQNILITSSSGHESESGYSTSSVVDGGGPDWWGIPYVGYAQVQEKRPVLLYSTRVKNMTIEYIVFKDAPFYTLQLFHMDGLIIRYSSIMARRTKKEGHSLLDLSAFNTDGIDVSGNNVHVHDVDIWNQDDCIAVKDNSTNMLFERIYASGLGLVIGSIGGSSIVHNITFRDSLIYKSYKGIYMKFRDDEGYGTISDILYDNIMIEEPIQWGMWIGPAQQSISSNICKPHPCSLCWPQVPMAQCNPMKRGAYRNITLRNVFIHNPKGSPGVILADESNPINTITFENVTVTRGAAIYSWNGRDIYSLFRGMDQPIDDHKAWIYGFTCISGILLVAFFWLAWTFMCHLIKFSTFYLSPNYSLWDEVEPPNMNDRMMKRKLSDDNDVVLSMIKKSNGRVNHILTFRSNEVWKRFIQAMIISFTAVMLFTIHNSLMVLVDRSNLSRFFVCKGVVNGVALAHTWPVPQCFVDNTSNSGYRMNLDSNKKNIVLMVELLLFIISCCWVLNNQKMHISQSIPEIMYNIETRNIVRGRSFTDSTGLISDSDASS